MSFADAVLTPDEAMQIIIGCGLGIAFLFGVLILVGVFLLGDD